MVLKRSGVKSTDAPSVWRVPDFRIVVASRFLSQMGVAALIVTVMLSLQANGQGTLTVALYLLSSTVPIMILAPWAGRIADTHDSRRIMVVGGLICAASALGMTIGAWLAPFPVPYFIVFTITLNIGNALLNPVWQALLPRIVGEDRNPEAIGALQASLTISQLVGTVLGAWILQISSAPVVFALATLGYLALTFGASRIQTRRHLRKEAPDAQPSKILDGFRAAKADPIILQLIIGVSVLLLFAQGLDVIELFLATETLGASEFEYGVLAACGALGMVAGAIPAGKIKDNVVRRNVYLAALIWIPLGAVVASFAPNMWFLYVVFFAFGVGLGALNSTYAALLIARSPENRRGQVASLSTAIMRTVGVVSVSLGGILGTILDPRSAYLYAGIVGVAFGLVALAFFLRTERRNDAAPVSAAESSSVQEA